MNNAARMLLIQSLLESKVCLSHAGPGVQGGTEPICSNGAKRYFQD